MLTYFKIISTPSEFISTKIEILTSIFNITAILDIKNMFSTYAISNKRTGALVSMYNNLLFDEARESIGVPSFYPDLPKAKGLSAAFFYLISHHYGEYFSFSEGTPIHLTPDGGAFGTELFDKFYGKLQGYDFKIVNGNIHGKLPKFDIDTSNIKNKNI